MPRRRAGASAWIAERPILQSCGVKPDCQPHPLQPCEVRGDEMGHPNAAPCVPVKPEATGQRVLDASPPETKLVPDRRVGASFGTYWHPMSPSTVAGDNAVTEPVNRAQVSGNDAGCVALADHPAPVASTMLSTTPGDVCIFSRETSDV